LTLVGSNAQAVHDALSDYIQ